MKVKASQSVSQLVERFWTELTAGLAKPWSLRARDSGPIAVKKLSDREKARRLAFFMLKDRALLNDGDANEEDIQVRGSSARPSEDFQDPDKQ